MNSLTQRTANPVTGSGLLPRPGDLTSGPRPALPARSGWPATAAEAVTRLDVLAAELAALGWTATVSAPAGRVPSLYARNPEPGAAALSEHVYAQPRGDGTWVFWWPWAEPIAESPAEAAAVIVRVLRPAVTS